MNMQLPLSQVATTSDWFKDFQNVLDSAETRNQENIEFIEEFTIFTNEELSSTLTTARMAGMISGILLTVVVTVLICVLVKKNKKR